MHLRLSIPILCCTLGHLPAQQQKEPAIDKVDYAIQIAPLLQQHCIECHGPQRHRNALRLDLRGAVLKGGRNGAAVVVGDAEKSLLLAKVSGQAAGRPMPLGREPLSHAQVALLAAWIDQGLPMPGADGPDDGTHWSYRKVTPPSLPALRDAGWCRQDLDRFVLAKLEQQGIAPAPECDRATWLRRVALDLCGLPPTPEEVQAFLGDHAADAFERQVDRLLESKHYGERWAQTWLDLARYADSQGYEKDDLRPDAWRWRDWVIDAFQRDLPFDQFTREQLAGDLLPAPTLEQRVATAFHRQTMTNTEGGTDDEEFRCAAVIDRVNTTMSVWMGSTLGCAQCHDHKFDPFSQQEYYQLFAFFDQTEDNDQPDERPTLRAPTPLQQAAQKQLELELTELRDRLRRDPAAVAAWASAQRQRLLAFAAAAARPDEWHAIGPFAAADFHSAHTTAFAPEQPEQGVQLDREQGGQRWLLHPEWHDGQVHRWSGDNSAFYLYRTIHADAAAIATLSLGSDDAIKVWWNGRELLQKEIGRAAAADQELLDLELVPGDNTLLLKITNGRGPSGFYFDLRPGPFDATVAAALAVAPGACSAAQQQQIAEAYGRFAPELAPLRVQIAARERELDGTVGPAVAILRELPADKRRTTRIHLHGSFLTQGEVVQPGTPACLPPLPAAAPRNRLGLVDWLVSTDNPLTARVQVNRLWEELFGRGLVDTSEDFGAQGDPPANPQLLDHLAARFMREGWSQKRLLRTVVLSATYRQRSDTRKELQDQDPYNRLCARGPCFRLSGETLRDQTLAVAGLLSSKIGGPSVMPPQPDGVWQQIYSGAAWQTSAGEDRWRRSLYTFWRRTSPHPTMTTFDAPSREFCVLRRLRTNTPLQALVTWNDPQFVEAAQALARRVLREADGEPARLLRMFRLCLLREPLAAERERLAALQCCEFARLLGDPAAAQQLATPLAGGSAPDEPRAAAELAAWTLVANVLLNLDEFVTKG
ncbi:MAG TPA: PSD1 and planctomycete cytochrome C domain-containing protein [Planctomycetota bacterium]|nr:PSD1 and planctomycete cytochrome C domain-containing protein [Planctomycetota bacterium]